jgi:hypothetical protein
MPNVQNPAEKEDGSKMAGLLKKVPISVNVFEIKARAIFVAGVVIGTDSIVPVPPTVGSELVMGP